MKKKTDKAAETTPVPYKVSTLWESDFGSVILADGNGAFPFVLARVDRARLYELLRRVFNGGS